MIAVMVARVSSLSTKFGLRSFPTRDDRTIERAKAFRRIQLRRNMEIVITMISTLLAIGGPFFSRLAAVRRYNLKSPLIITSILIGAALFLAGSIPAIADSTGACGYYTNKAGHQVPRPCGNWRDRDTPPPSNATARCRDGTWSSSEHPHAWGTCSYHGSRGRIPLSSGQVTCDSSRP
jgi:uncharacterized protein DUF3761